MAQKIINSSAPIRICDNGGWTDTWFAEHGEIFNIGVSPFAEVQIEVYPLEEHHDQIELFAENYNDRYMIDSNQEEWKRHPLLEAAINYMPMPDDVALRINVFSNAPSGASTGTSAAVTVALIGALDRLTPGCLTLHEVAYTAQKIETDVLGLQSGIQDQLCAAYGGINYIQMFQYPYCSVSQPQISNPIMWDLEQRLVLIYLGKSHNSSNVHEKVIHELEDKGPDNPKINALRSTAKSSINALLDGRFAEFGRIITLNTQYQADLNPALVGDDAHCIIDIAKAHNALGWKVNGAGGDGGSVTLLCGPSFYEKRKMIQAIEEANSLYSNIPIRISHHGLQVWESLL